MSRTCRRRRSRSWPGRSCWPSCAKGRSTIPASRRSSASCSRPPSRASSSGTSIWRPSARLQFRSFLMENADWLSDYALFRVLMEENGNLPTWDRWAPEHRSPRSARTWLLSLPEKRRDELMRKQLFFMYVQWLAFGQWQALKAYGTAQKVYLMGDIPFGVGRYQRRCLGQPRHLRPRLERRRAAGEGVQGGPLHREVGAELGHPQLPLGRIAPARLRLVAHPRRQHPEGLPPLSH